MDEMERLERMLMGNGTPEWLKALDDPEVEKEVERRRLALGLPEAEANESPLLRIAEEARRLLTLEYLASLDAPKPKAAMKLKLIRGGKAKSDGGLDRPKHAA